MLRLVCLFAVVPCVTVGCGSPPAELVATAGTPSAREPRSAAARSPSAPAAALSITGSVLDPGGAAVPYATVIYHRVTDDGTVWGGQEVTDGEGRFELADLAAGHYILQGRALGFIEPSVFNPTGDPVAAGSSGVVVSVARGGTIAGRIVGPDGAPIAGANIVVQMATADGAMAKSDLSDDAGGFSFPGLADGTYTLRATDSHLDDITETVTIELLGGGSPPEVVLRASLVP